MKEREVRMRTIEALSTMGVRAGSDLIRHSAEVVDWVMAGEGEPEFVELVEDEPQDEDKSPGTPRVRGKKSGAKVRTPS